MLREAITAQDAPDLPAIAAAGDIDLSAIEEFLAKTAEPDGPAITAMADFLGITLPEINVVDFLRSGYIPEAMLNFVALLGWSPAHGREIMTRRELIDSFDMDRFNKTNSLFDRQKLMSFNTEHLRSIDDTRRLSHFRNYLGAVDSPLNALPDEELSMLLTACLGARTLAEIADKGVFLVTDTITYDPKAVKKVLSKPGVADVLDAMIAAFDTLDTWTPEAIHKVIEDYCTQHDLGMGKVAQPIRVAITGTMVSPPIGESLTLLGKDRTVDRLRQTIAFIETLPS